MLGDVFWGEILLIPAWGSMRQKCWACVEGRVVCTPSATTGSIYCCISNIYAGSSCACLPLATRTPPKHHCGRSRGAQVQFISARHSLATVGTDSTFAEVDLSLLFPPLGICSAGEMTGPESPRFISMDCWLPVQVSFPEFNGRCGMAGQTALCCLLRASTGHLSYIIWGLPMVNL